MRQFINGINNEATTAIIIKQFMVLKHISEVSSKQVLVEAQRVET